MDSLSAEGLTWSTSRLSAPAVCCGYDTSCMRLTPKEEYRLPHSRFNLMDFRNFHCLGCSCDYVCPKPKPRRTIYLACTPLAAAAALPIAADAYACAGLTTCCWTAAIVPCCRAKNNKSKSTQRAPNPIHRLLIGCKFFRHRAQNRIKIGTENNIYPNRSSALAMCQSAVFLFLKSRS